MTCVNTENPHGKTDLCARFDIPDNGDRFTLENVTVTGVKYTLCLWLRSEAEGSVELLGEAISTSTQWKRYAVTFTAQSRDLGIGFAAGTYYLYHIKLETGTKATDYTPAPEDMASGADLEAINEEFLSVRESIAAVDIRADGIIASVSEVKKNADTAIQTLDSSLKSLERSVEAKMTSEAVQIEIKKALDSGASKVVTTTGYTLDENGITVEKSGREMKTQITEDGMTVLRSGGEVLTAGSDGVNAKNLHATTYLTVGGRSRFENYGSGRTGCFWIGGE